MHLERITPLLLTYNEEANISRTLERLAWAERIVVVDSHSTDGTLDLLREHPQVEVHKRDFDNHRDQWNYGLDRVETKWVLTLDADYVLSKAFIEELQALTPTEDGYYARFRYRVFGEPLRGSLYPPRLVLFRNGKGRYVQDGHTQRLELKGSTGELSAPIYHDDRKPLRAWLKAQDRYARAEAEKLRTTPDEELAFVDRLRKKKFFAPVLSFLHCLLGKGLILDGKAGFYYVLQRTYAELLLSLRLLDRDLRRDE